MLAAVVCHCLTVLQGAKYVIRTDVLYKNPPKEAAAGRGKAKASK